VHGNRLSDDEAICNELADGLAGIGIGDFADFIGIEPDLALSASYDGCRKALLGGEVDPIVKKKVSFDSRCAKSITYCDYISFAGI